MEKKITMKKKMTLFMLAFLLIVSSLAVSRKNVEAMRFYGSYVYNCSTSVVMRQSPSASSKALCKIPYGQAVTYMYGVNKTNGYYEVAYNGKTGWILAKYCTWTGNGLGASATYYPHTTTGKITLRKTKSTKSAAVTTIPKGAVVFTKQTSTTGTWIYVKYKKASGYLPAKYLN